MIYSILNGKPEFAAKKGDMCLVLDTHTFFICLGGKSWIDEEAFEAARASQSPADTPKKAKRTSRSKKTPSTPK